MRRFRTLRGRLTAFALIATTVTIGLVVVAFNLLLASSLNGDVNSRLRGLAAAAATTVQIDDGRITVREAPNDRAIDAQLWVFDGRRAVLRPGAQPALQRAAATLARSPSRRLLDVDSSESRLYAMPLTDEAGRRVGTVVSAASLAANDRTTELALVGTVALAVLLLAAVLAVTWLAIGRALDPVTEMTRSAASWSEHDLDRRFGPAERPDELGQLARTFDALLDRVAASLRHEQRLSAELSHELRTPLARILAEMELLQRRERSTAERAEAYEVVMRSVEQMHRVLETLMAVARAEAQPERGRSDLREALDALAQVWEDPLAGHGVALELPAGEAARIVGVDADVVERILAPLLDNAGRHARSRVVVDAASDGGRVRVVVRDDGPGLADGEAERIFDPGQRGAQADGHPGAGLGLPLSRRLARAVGGDVRALAGAGPGAAFAVDLPA